MKKINEIGIKFIKGLVIALFTLGISVIFTLNLKIIYEYCIDKFKLNYIVNLSKEDIMLDYNNLINYLQNPFNKKLSFDNFIMSKNGEIHFFEVKRIFLFIYLITLIIFILGLIYIYINKINKNKTNIYKDLNYGANTLILFICIIASSMLLDFSKAFIIFHKIFFKNDYWIFDERLDPIIKVLPEEVFMIYAVVILILVLLFIISYKIYYYKNINKEKVMINNIKISR